MREITDSEISDTTAKFLRYLFRISDKLLIVDVVVLNNIGYCYDRGHSCGLLNLQNEMGITKERISSSITRWLKLGFIEEVPSKTDRRLRYFIPTQKMFESRAVAFNDIRAMHKRLRGDQ